MLHSWRKKYVKWATFDAFLRVNFFLIFFSRRLSFPFKYGKAILWWSWRLKSQNFPIRVNHVHDTDLSKLVSLCPVKKHFLISTPVEAQRVKPLEALTVSFIKLPTSTQIVLIFLGKILLDQSNFSFLWTP